MSFFDRILARLGPKAPEEVDIDVDDFRVRSEPITPRLILDWSPDSIRRVVANADGGDMSSPADLWTAIMRDARVRGIMQTRTLGQIALPLDFDCPPKGKSCLRHVQSVWERAMPDAELSRLIEWGLGVGVGVAQLVWQPCGPTYIPTLDVWDAHWLRYDYTDPDCPRWYVQSYNDPKILVAEGGQVMPGWVLYLPYGHDAPWRRGLFQQLAAPWLLKQYAMLDRARHSEVNGSPAWVGTTEGLSEAQRRQFLSDLHKMARDVRIVLPQGCSLDLLEATGGTSDIYRETIEWSDSEIAIAIAGQSVTTEGTQGFAEGDIHERILSTLIRSTANSLETCLYEQVMRPWSAYEFGDADRAPHPRWRTVPREDLQREAAAIQTLGQGVLALDQALSASGMRVDVAEIAKRFNLPLVELPKEVEAEIQVAEEVPDA